MNPIRVRDDVLQFLYWMKGERLGEAFSLPQLTGYLRQPEGDLSRAVSALLESGLLEREDDGRLRLSALGELEGRRRFEDEFEPYLGHESHLMCDDPDCDCHSPDWEGDCRHLAAPGRRS